MMEKEVILTLRSETYSPGQPPEKMELLTPGLLSRTEEGWRLSYQETELSGMEGTVTELTVSKERMVLLRRGSTASCLEFRPGKTHCSLYETPYGGLTLEVRTRQMYSDLSEQGGKISLRYSVALEHQLTGEHAMTITVREK